MIEPLEAARLYHPCRLDATAFEDTRDLEPLEGTVGQERALEAIAFGISMPHGDYNIYVMGSDGIGRHTVIRDALKRVAGESPTPPDWCYVANFTHPHNPRILSVPAGNGQQLRRDMVQLIEDLLSAIPAAFQSDEYKRRAKEVEDDFKRKDEEATNAVARSAGDKGVALLRGPSGFTLAPQKDGEVLSSDDFKELPEEEQQKIGEIMREIKRELREAMNRIPEWHREMRQKLKALDRETMEVTVAHFIQELKKRYSTLEPVLEYLTLVEQDMIENVDQFRQQEAPDEARASADDPVFSRYQVNLLVDNAGRSGAPVVTEDNPTYPNLIGRIEHIARLGTLLTDFTLIKAGALHRANGGYLILDADKVLTSPFAWGALKRVLKAGEIKVESLERQLSLVSTISLEPQPAPIDVKVVLVGSRLLYYLLKQYDPEFGLLFKVNADFAEKLDRSAESEMLFARLVATLQRQEKLLPIGREAVARVIEQGARRVGDGERLSLHLGELIDLLKESDYWARKGKSDRVGQEHVESGIDAQERRSSQLREELHRQILRGTVEINTTGTQLAQANGLSVIQLGDFSFGIPTRISATARVGNGELIDIERETEQGGPIHSKGVLTLATYLGERYSKHQPLSVTASLVFEQTYGGVEGDSASCAELCALLSAIGDLPLDQGLAVTGSVNQHGQVQAIGGVCEKIEGFFRVCEARGLTGRQGVIIPASNVKNLMLRRSVVEAVEQGLFQVYAASHVDQVMERLTGLPAGIQNAKGVYPEGSVNYAIQLRLAEWIALRQHYASRTDADLKEE